MNDVNYIKHLNALFLQFSKDHRLNPTHISLYMALFQLWNSNRFPEAFYLNREEVMQLSKIGSKSTYHRCIRELHHWKYVIYYPSHNPYKGSRVRLLKFDTSDGQAIGGDSPKNGTSDERALVPINKPIQSVENKKNILKPKNMPYKSFEKKYKEEERVPYRDNLKTTKDKNYNEPL